MFARWFLLILVLSAPALAEEGTKVRVRCPESCTVVFDGKNGLRINDSTWEFKGIAPGTRRVDAKGSLGRPLASGFADIPKAAEVSVFVSNKRITVEQVSGGGERSATKGKGGGKASTAIVHCPDDCTASIDGVRGLRLNERMWEFKDVEPGQRRVEASGGLLNRRMFVGYVDMPAGSEVHIYGDSKGHVALADRKDLGPEKSKGSTSGGKPSRLSIRCQRSCTVEVDGTRKGSSNATNVVINDVTPGSRMLKVSFQLGGRVARGAVDVKADSEVFVTATENGLQVTNTKPLEP